MALDDEGRETKRFAAMALGEMDARSNPDALVLSARSPHPRPHPHPHPGELSRDHRETQSAVAEAGAIVPLVALLDGDQGSEAQEAAAGALFALADHDSNRLAITEADGIGWLVQLLGCDNPKAREHAEGALVKLSIENANRVMIIKKLVDMLQDSGTHALQSSDPEPKARAWI